MPSIYQPRRPRASPLWQLVHHGWDDFLANYEDKRRHLLTHLFHSATDTLQKTQDDKTQDKNSRFDGRASTALRMKCL